jgi:hypothetical protein
MREKIVGKMKNQVLLVCDTAGMRKAVHSLLDQTSDEAIVDQGL